MDFRAGDVLMISCPFTPAAVTSVSACHVSVRWPWWQVDPDLDWIDWNGEVALARESGSHDWADELFRTEPAVETLRAGDACRVGIPPTVVRVLEVQHFDPPRETGWLPRPRRNLLVLRQGLSRDPDREDQGYGIDPDDDIPMDIRPLFRPYAFLEVGDDVADARGRAWRFDGLWHWHAYDGAGAGTPIWPLTLLSRSGVPGLPAEVEVVAVATRSGAHETELARWSS